MCVNELKAEAHFNNQVVFKNPGRVRTPGTTWIRSCDETCCQGFMMKAKLFHDSSLSGERVCKSINAV